MSENSVITESGDKPAEPTALDQLPFSRFHAKITAMTLGANFSDGYALGIIGAILPTISVQLGLSSFWEGMIASSALIGLFFGSLILGRVGDIIGRQRVYVLNFALIAAVSLMQLWTPNVMALFVLRVLIGFGLGADYAVGPTLMSEFAPRKQRGAMLASLTVAWTVGYVAANVIATYLNTGDDSWRWLLASGAIPAVIVLVVRIGTPESPGWLISKGRVDEARAIVRRCFGVELDTSAYTQEGESVGYRELFSQGNRVRTWFGILFFSALVLPYFAIYTFVPTILSNLNVENADLQYLILNLFLLVGGIAGIWFVAKMPRRSFTILSFGVLAVSLAALGALSNVSVAAMMIPFVIYTFVMSAASNITQVYPPELFPTSLRASGVGLLNGLSRIASAAGTFALPLSLTNWGISTTMYWLAGVLLLGMLISIRWAPETRSQNLV
ncbi:MFS transporter [Prescottella agglutinans]|uniref:MFS transporter n=1 Tax=Prescottella agglutinans TaxID=1644129 RepID=A0ABT6M7T1_9NOCA|nr:MFS transporter [Prescottella agglutinans]MDH6280363.1 putative MFS transporter [Prescottella agglutinans]